MDLRDSVLSCIREYGMLAGADRVVCALSGGADSVCLADVLLFLSSELGFRLECAHFNHRLRGEESERDAAFVADWCAERSLKLHLGSGDVAAYAAEHRLSIEEAGRALRYGFLESLGDEKTRIATAHQADDQAETLLLNLLRGSGLKGLGGIPPVRGPYIRPLLYVTREEILDYLRQRDLVFMEDSSNSDSVYRRNRIRHEVLPVLRALNPMFSTACGRTARLLRADETLLDEMAAKAFVLEGESAVLSVKELLALPEPLSSRALRQAAGVFGVLPEEKHISALLKLAASRNPSARLELPSGLTVRRQYDRMIISRCIADGTFPETELRFGAWTEIPEHNLLVFWGEKTEITKIHGKFTTYFFKKSMICGNIAVRPRQESDHLQLPGRPGKSLKKWMIQEKIPAAVRDSIPVFADESGVVAVWGLGADTRAAALPEVADTVLVILERT
ncbi:MAG: tRNA lysidine(34) synthetase TilS [Oscillospiraceae bacterium]|nr:tRNA lysidine(34) synthetase TilS [Oscillospiraceae bacterium]